MLRHRLDGRRRVRRAPVALAWWEEQQGVALYDPSIGGDPTLTPMMELPRLIALIVLALVLLVGGVLMLFWRRAAPTARG